MSRVSVLVPSMNRPEHLRECLQAILANDFADFELLVLDQSTNGDSAQVIEALGDSRARYSHLDRPGKSRSLNYGIRESKGEILCFTDDDCLPSSTWINTIVREFDADPKMSMVLGQTLPKFLGPADRPAFAYHESPNRRVYERHRNPYGVGGAGGNMAFRRQTILTIGPFDEDFGPGARFKAVEDNEYFYRVFKAGLRALYSPEMLVYHKQLHSVEEVGRIDRAYRFGNAAFIGKYLRRGDLWPLRYYLAFNIERIWEGVIRFKPRKIRRTLVSFIFFSWGLAKYFHQEIRTGRPDRRQSEYWEDRAWLESSD